MIGGSYCVIAKKYPEYAVGSLLSVVVVQGEPYHYRSIPSFALNLYTRSLCQSPGLGYGLIFDLSFFLRNLSVIGGLLMVLSDSLQSKKKLFAGLPSISETDRRK
jgi:hypothetical protein